MKVFYYLKTCDTCKKLIKLLTAFEDIEYREIKTNPLSEIEIDDLANLASGYENLFNKRAKLYKEHQLKTQNLTELDYRKWLNNHYTFLKRPVLVIENKIHIGNNQKSLENFIDQHLR